MERKFINSYLLALVTSVCILLLATYSWGGNISRGRHYSHSIRPMTGQHGYYKYDHGYFYYGYRHGKNHRYNKHKYGKRPYKYRPEYGGRITTNFNIDDNASDKAYKKNPEHYYKYNKKRFKNSKANEVTYKKKLIEQEWFR